MEAPRYPRNLRDPPTQAQLDIPLPRHPAAPSIARRELARFFTRRLGEALVTDMSIVANELVGNAVAHGEGAIRMQVRATGRRASLEVSDQGHGFIAPLNPPSHKGLAIVDALTESWGVSVGSTHVWCNFAVAPR